MEFADLSQGRLINSCPVWDIVTLLQQEGDLCVGTIAFDFILFDGSFEIFNVDRPDIPNCFSGVRDCTAGSVFPALV